jgi:hypothetical protein
MKDAIFGYYGMQRVAPLVRGWGYAYMFRNADQSTANTCLSVLNGYLFNKYKFIMTFN